MPKLSTQLTITAIKNLKPKDKIYFVGDGDNLLLKIKPNGGKTFVYEYKSPQTNKIRRITLGEYGTISLQEAREKRNELKKQVFKGFDVLEAGGFKEFGEIFNDWIKTKEKKITDKQLFWIRRKFETIFLPKFDKSDMKNLTRKDIIGSLQPLLTDDKIETAYKVLSVLNSFYKYALLHEYVEHNIISDIDKKTLLGVRKINHYAFLKSDDEIRNY
ncbi:MAG: Arm DNA-binding domain-containing protein [Campylobacter sp.]|nr:Arm DNA-binding domain-containing protein [Campylobacter sp.]